MKVLVIGPSYTKSKGGMATVIKGIVENNKVLKDTEVAFFPSYVDGSKLVVLLYSIIGFFCFFMTCRNYDIYHIHMASKGSTYRKSLYIKAALRWGKKVIVHIHGGGFIDFYDHLSIKKRLSIKKMLNKADCVIALSNEWKEIYVEKFGLSNCIVVENGIDVDFYRNSINNVDSFRKSFLFLGRLVKGKGVYDLIKAVSLVKERVPDIKIYLAGDGEIDVIKEKIDSLSMNENIILVGWADDTLKRDLLSKVSTVVLPSYHEALPMCILEGMACGKLILSTNVGAIPEVVQESNGILITAGDIHAMAEAMFRIAATEMDLESISCNNLNLIKSKYDVNVMHKKLLDCYESLV